MMNHFIVEKDLEALILAENDVIPVGAKFTIHYYVLDVYDLKPLLYDQCFFIL